MSVKQRLEQAANELTTTEKRLSAALLADYPFAGLESIHELAARVSTSAPSISRFVTKLGFNGFQGFQRHLIEELKQGQRSPAEIKQTGEPVQGAYLNTFLSRAALLLATTGDRLSEPQFERICHLLNDPKRAVHLIGGRMSDTLVQYLARHLSLAREGVRHMPADPEFWPEHILAMRPGDVLFIADFRRYQPGLLQLAKRAAEHRKVKIIVLTDTWLSPASKYATEVLPVPIDSGTLWDSYAAALAVVEAIVTRVAEDNWEQVQRRMATWDDLRSTENENTFNA